MMMKFLCIDTIKRSLLDENRLPVFPE